MMPATALMITVIMNLTDTNRGTSFLKGRGTPADTFKCLDFFQGFFRGQLLCFQQASSHLGVLKSTNEDHCDDCVAVIGNLLVLAVLGTTLHLRVVVLKGLVRLLSEF